MCHIWINVLVRHGNLHLTCASPSQKCSAPKASGTQIEAAAAVDAHSSAAEVPEQLQRPAAKSSSVLADVLRCLCDMCAYTPALPSATNIMHCSYVFVPRNPRRNGKKKQQKKRSASLRSHLRACINALVRHGNLH